MGCTDDSCPRTTTRRAWESVSTAVLLAGTQLHWSSRLSCSTFVLMHTQRRVSVAILPALTQLLGCRAFCCDTRTACTLSSLRVWVACLLALFELAEPCEPSCHRCQAHAAPLRPGVSCMCQALAVTE